MRTEIIRAVVVILIATTIAATILSLLPGKTITYECPYTEQQGLRDTTIFILRPNDVEKYEDLSKYVEVMEGDTIHIQVFDPSYPDGGNDQSDI